MAGLLAARVLADRFDAVTVIERDPLLDDSDPRKGVPQGRHVHGLLAKGASVVEELFPGISQSLQADGAQELDLSADWRWFHFSAYKARFPSGVTALVQSRPLLELHVRRRVAALPNVGFKSAHDVVDLSSASSHRITGVNVRCRESAAVSPILADLVVDATGRGSRAPTWLQACGLEPPDEETFRIDVTYTSRIFRRRPDDMPDAKMLFVNPHPPAGRRMGAIVPIEDERWMVSLCGWLGEHAPANEAGFLDFARGLAMPDVFNVLQRLEPMGSFATHKFPSNQRRHFERMKRFPEGFIAVGDAVCSFNPVYGQGMTVASLGALALRDALASGVAGLPRRFFKRLARIIDVPWSFTASEDLRYPEVSGDRPRGTRFLHWYCERLYAATSTDPEVCRTFLKVMNMVRPPTDLFRPSVAYRVLAGAGETRAALPVAQTP